MFVKVFDKERSRRQAGPKSAESSPRPGRPSSRFVIHSQEDLQHHWKEAKKKHKLEKDTVDEDVELENAEQEVIPSTSQSPVKVITQEQPPTSTPDVSQLSLLADASMVQDRETVNMEHEVMGVLVPNQNTSNTQSAEIQMTKSNVGLASSSGVPEPGEIVGEPGEIMEDGEVSYEPVQMNYDEDGEEDGEIRYTSTELEPVATNTAVESYHPTVKLEETAGVRTRRSSARVESAPETPAQQAPTSMTTRSRGQSGTKTYARTPKPVPVTSPSTVTGTPALIKPIDINTPDIHASPYGTRKKRIILPESLMKPSLKKVKLEEKGAVSSPRASGQLHSLLVSDTAGTKVADGDQLIAGDDVTGMDIQNETHVELIIKGEPEDEVAENHS